MTSAPDRAGARRGGSFARGLGLVSRDILMMLPVAAAAWLLHVYGRVLPTPAIIATWIVAAGLIAAGRFRRARLRRAAFLSAYFRPGAALARRLRGGWLMAAREAVLGAALAAVLGVELIRLTEAAAWVVLVAGVPLVALVRAAARAALARSVSPAYLPELEWRTTMPVVGAIVLAALVVLAFHRPYPDVGGVSLERAVWHFVDQERAESAGLEILLQLAAAQEGLRLWLAEQLMPQPGASLAEAFGWLIVLAVEALFVWSYLLFLSAVPIVASRDERDSIRTE